MSPAAACPVLTRVLRICARYSARAAVVAADQVLSYEELSRRVEQWRRRCAALGLAPGSLVCVVADGQAEFPAAFLGVRAAGLVPMPVDGVLSGRVASIVEHARPAAVVCLTGDEIAPQPADQPRTLPAEAGYVVFSSGSQGAPKGIVGQARGLAHFIDWEAETIGVGAGTRTAMLTSPSFDVVLRDLLLPLCTGGELHIPPSTVRTSPSAVLPWLADHAIEVVHAVPSLGARWVEAAGEPAVQVPELRWTLFAGEPLYAQHIDRWRSVAPRSRVLNLYGPAETTLARFCHEVPPEPAPGVQPVGRPLPNTTFELEPVEPGQNGNGVRRVVIASPDGSLGYLADTCSPADQSRLRRESGTTRFATQDRGLLDDNGDLVVSGRLDSLVKRNGALVDIARMERAAIELPDVRTACCLQLVPSGRIVLVVDGLDSAAAADLRRRLRPRLGMELPDEIRAVRALPLLPGGKVDRGAVRDLVEGAVSGLG